MLQSYFIYAHKTSEAFLVPAFTELLLGQRHSLHITCIEFHLNWTVMWKARIEIYART
jgi:hypothetical protein